MTNKCKICGGQVTVDAQNGIAVCDYCGTKQALPLFAQDSEKLLYERGNNYLLHSEYDKAENVFNQLLTIKPNAAELYWDLVLCKYGVTYVQDPRTGKYIPTCNRTHYTSVFSDQNYQKAIELSSGDKKALFEEDAQTINNIQKGILAVSKKEKPFDIFISYKETDAQGNRTKDSVEAQRIYEKLTEAGYKVFFSRITLEDKIGTEYEPYIYAALYSSKVMLTVCSSRENIEAAWVKNEWSRFLGFRQNDNTKTLLPLYFDMGKTELPDEFALLAAYDMSVDGFAEELLRGIQKLIPLPVMLAKRRQKIAKITGITLASLAVAAGIAAAIIIPKEREQRRLQAEAAMQASEAAANEKAYQAAMTLFENRNYTAASEAFAALGDYMDAGEMASMCIHEEDYQAAMTLFQNADYTAASEAFSALENYKDSVYMVTRCEIQPGYDEAMQLYYDGKYAQAAWAFGALGDYEDAAAKKEKAELSWRKSLATVMTDNAYNFSSTHYVTANGTVSEQSTGKETISAGEHGKVISISNGNGGILTLCEDGTAYVSWSEEVYGQDVIQIVPRDWVFGNIALRSDGTVLIDDVENPDYQELAVCYEDVSEWKNIVMLASHTQSGGNADFDAALAGVDAEGNVFLCAHFSWSPVSDYQSFAQYPDLFRNIKTIDIEMDRDFDEEINYVNAVALTNDGKVVTYINGKTSEIDAADVVDVCLYYGDVYLLSSDGKLRTTKSSKVIANDVVTISDGFVCSDYFPITRSGAIVGQDGCKTAVHDEWLIRME